MTGCQTCGGFGNRHDPIAHDVATPAYDELTCHQALHEDGDWYCAAHGQSWPCAADERGFFTYDENGRRVTE